MKIVGLKILTDKGWKQDSTFTGNDGRTVAVPANHKIVCLDESNDIVNVTISTPTPLTFKPNQLIDIRLSGSVSKTSFGWTVKAVMV